MMTLTCKTIDVIPCESNHGKTKNFAARFPQRLKEAHNDTIRIREGAVYRGVGSRPKEGKTYSDYYIPVVCMVCGHEWGQTPFSLVNMKRGCHECHKKRQVEYQRGIIGKKKPRKSTPEERLKARQLFAELGNKAEVGRILGRTTRTICQWLDDELYQRHLGKGRECHAKHRATGHSQKVSAAYRQTKNGRANKQKAAHKRRALQYHCADNVYVGPENLDELCPPFVDPKDIDPSNFVDYNIWDLVEPEDYHLFTFEGADEDVAKRKVQQEKLSKISGEKYSLEHLVPLSKGGIHHPANFANRALALNVKKNDKRLDEDDALFCKRLFGL